MLQKNFESFYKLLSGPPNLREISKPSVKFLKVKKKFLKAFKKIRWASKKLSKLKENFESSKNKVS